MQPEIYYALMTSGRHGAPVLEFEFELFNPFLYNSDENDVRVNKEMLDLLYQCVDEIMQVKKSHPTAGSLLDYLLTYIEEHPGSSLTQVNNKIEMIMSGYQFLIIESSDTYGVHPLFYTPGFTLIDTPEGACEKDIIESLYGLLFLEAALQQDKPVWGTCHGAHVGFIHAGGALDRLFDYKEIGHGDISFTKRLPAHTGEEVWHIDKMLYTPEPGSNYQKSAIMAYAVPEKFIPEHQKGSTRYLNKDFQHSLAMTPPVPEAIEVISWHPMSQYKSNVDDTGYREANQAFREVLNDQAIVDAYQYKTMLGVQYHPQFTYDDLETALVFDYLVNQIRNRYR